MKRPPREDFLIFGAPALEEAEIREVEDCLRSGWLGSGPRVARFEKLFEAYKGGGHATAVNSCTAALHLSILAAGLRPGDEVITSPMTFCATVNAILHAGAVPVLADVDPKTWNINPAEVEAKITPKTKAILPVHFAGRPCDMDALVSMAERRGLKIIEDCAHAIESEDKGRKTGTMGDFGCFSFYATKNVATGEGGMVLARRAEDAARIRTLALHGMSADAWKRFGDEGYKHYEVVECGFKYNMMDLQAALGIHQLGRVEQNWERRRALWERYQEELADLPLALPAPVEKDVRHSYHLYGIRIDEERAGISRDGFLAEMTKRGIGVGVHYRSLPEHRFYRETLGWKPEDYPHARKIGRETVSLPLSPRLSDADAERVVRAVREILRPQRNKGKTVVVQAVPKWLEMTSNWIHNQIVHLDASIDNWVACHETQNLDHFSVSRLHVMPVKPTRGLEDPFFQRELSIFLVRTIRRSGAAVLHSHWGDQAWLHRDAARETAVAHVATFYGKDVNFLPARFPVWRERYAELFREIDLVLCEGPHMAGCIRRLGCPAEKVRVHPLGISVDDIPFSPRSWRRGETLRVLLAASFREKKGIPYAVEALGRLNRDLEDVEITIIGDSGEDPRSASEKEKILAVLEKHGLRSRTRLLGYQPHAVLSEEARRHHLFLHPSVTASDGDTEGGAPVIVIEMAATGMPVISTTHCDIPYVIVDQETGLLAPERDVDALLAHLRWLVAHPERWETLARAARRRVEEMFSVRRQASKLGEIYRELAAGRGKPNAIVCAAQN